MSNPNDFISSMFEQEGYAVLPGHFGLSEVAEVSREIRSIQNAPDVDVYLDRSGQLRRLEHFTYLSDFLTEKNE